MWVCLCFAVTDAQVDAAIRDGARTEEDIGLALGAGTNCTNCLPAIRERLRAAARNEE